MYLYEWRNKVSGRSYFGITRHLERRLASHKHAIKSGRKTPFYDSVRSYGWENFDQYILSKGSEKHIAFLEQLCIEHDSTCYNLHLGGHIGFDVTTKDATSVEEWKLKLRQSRKGRKPAEGMKHTEEIKRICGEFGKIRWDIYGRYPKEVLDYGFAESNKKFGISKTHYYRLRKAIVE